MIIKLNTWNSIRVQFTEEEKLILREAVDGEIIYPAGWSIDESKVAEPLLSKLKGFLRG